MAQLPPKIPSSMTHNWPPAFPPHHRRPPLTGSTTTAAAAAQLSPPTTAAHHQHPSSWDSDNFPDFTASRRGSHRRSISDSVTFLEAAPELLIDHRYLHQDCRNISSHHHHPSSLPLPGGTGGGGFDRLDDDQLMSMFSDDIPGSAAAENPSSPSSDHQNNNNNNDNDNWDIKAVELQNQTLPKAEPAGEVDSSATEQQQQQKQEEEAPPAGDSSNNFIDPKRVKRVLANRQSARRSRVRKLHYISELEKSVTTLQTEVSALSPRVAFLDHQRLILNVDNSALKQRIAALAQDKIFKDAHQEALKKEIERLRQIYHQQSMKKLGNGSAVAAASATPTSDDSVACTETQQQLTA